LEQSKFNTKSLIYKLSEAFFSHPFPPLVTWPNQNKKPGQTKTKNAVPGFFRD
jgi:hypothetical protein